MIYFINFFLFMILFACNQKPENKTSVLHYNLSKPDKVITLPAILHEVSGITFIDSVTVAMVQDEDGIIFIYDIEKEKIIREIPFYNKGDYEGIARVQNSLYVLRSDGLLLEVSNYNADNFSVTPYPTGIPAKDNEGLCYDALNERLLIGCKSKAGDDKTAKDFRAVYSFNLKTKILDKEPIINFSLNDVNKIAKEKDIMLPPKTNKKGELVESQIKMRTSAIAIHPFSEKLYLLSASEHLLFISDLNGNIEHIEQLDSALFNKAEGIIFDSKATMYITNEGQKDKPRLLMFDYQCKQ